MIRLCTLLFLFAAAYGQEQAPGRLLVQVKPQADKTKVAVVLAANKAKILKTIPAINVTVLSVPESAREGITIALLKSGHFEFVEPDFVVRAHAVANDPYYPKQWHLPKISAPQAWDVSRGSTSVPVVILDSGVDKAQPDLSAKILAGKNFLDGSANTQDNGCSIGHGTAVAGAAAAQSNNGLGVAGVAWLNPIVPGVVWTKTSSTNPECYGLYSTMAAAITWAADQGYRVANLSGGGAGTSSVLQSAVDYAWNKGLLLVASAGNLGNSTPYYPAAYAHTISVGASDQNDNRTSFSNYGNWVALFAPGTSIYTTQLGGSYGMWWGTSLASPIVAGALALALALKPGSAPADLKAALQSSADLTPAGPRLNISGLLSQLASIQVPCSAQTDKASMACAASLVRGN